MKELNIFETQALDRVVLELLKSKPGDFIYIDKNSNIEIEYSKLVFFTNEDPQINTKIIYADEIKKSKGKTHKLKWIDYLNSNKDRVEFTIIQKK